MAVEFIDSADSGVLEVRCQGRLDKEDYHRFVPKTEGLIEKYGKINVLFEMHDFHGWDLGALWEDLKFDLKHFRDIGRLAVVGEKRWQKWMSGFCKPFTRAEIRYFDREGIDEARRWISEGLGGKEPAAAEPS